MRVAAAIAAASAYAEARAAAGAPAPAPLPGFTLPGEREAVSLARLGYVAFDPLMSAAFADALPAEVDRLIAAGLFTAPADRLVDGTPTEWLANLGLVAGNGPGSPVFTASPLLRALFAGLQELGRRYNDLRPVLLASGVPEAEAPEIAVEGMELNVNKVIPPWSGLHPHQDHHRFTAAAQRVLPGDVRHAAMRARVFTISGYARPRGPDGNPLNDAGGALTFYVRRGARSAEEKAIHDVVLAAHNTGAAFFAHTLHGVARMTRPGSVRYSFQAFFPEASAWREIAARLLGGEEARR